MYSHERKKGTPVTRARDGPGSQESLDLAAFPTLHYVFLVIKTTVSTCLETMEMMSFVTRKGMTFRGIGPSPAIPEDSAARSSGADLVYRR